MIRIARQANADAINQVLNDPEVRPWIAEGSNFVDLSAQVANPRNVVLMGEHGGCAFLQVLPGIYEVHTQVLPSGRGAWTNLLTEACVQWMFLKTDCFEILTRVPKGHVGAKTAALTRGMRYEFTRHGECKFNGKLVDVDIYSFRLQDWAPSASDMIPIGRQFHDRLHAEAFRLGVKDPAHDDDENHNLYVGIALTMLRNGLAAKGVNFYNRWATVVRHDRISLLADKPQPVVRIDHGIVVAIGEEDIEVYLP